MGCDDAKPVDLIVLVGIQASGKTTFYRRHLASECVHVSLDHWRGKGNARRKEEQAIREGLAAAAGSDGRIRGVVVDNTNITAETRRRYFDYAAEFSRGAGRTVRVVAYFFDADLEGCLARNRQREVEVSKPRRSRFGASPADAPAGVPYYVPPPAIRSFHKRLEPPTPDEGFEQVLRVRIAADGSFAVEPAAPAGNDPA